MVPGPSTRPASRRCCRTSLRSSDTASVNSTSTSDTVATTRSSGDPASASSNSKPIGPISAPMPRNTATCGTPVRSTQPDSRAETMITAPTRASIARKGSTPQCNGQIRPLITIRGSRRQDAVFYCYGMSALFYTEVDDSLVGPLLLAGDAEALHVLAFGVGTRPREIDA